MTNHFAEAESLLKRANECVVDSITRNLVARATVHATLAQVQVMRAGFGALTVSVEHCDDIHPDAYDPAALTSVVSVETRETSGDRL